MTVRASLWDVRGTTVASRSPTVTLINTPSVSTRHVTDHYPSGAGSGGLREAPSRTEQTSRQRVRHRAPGPQHEWGTREWRIAWRREERHTEDAVRSLRPSVTPHGIGAVGAARLRRKCSGRTRPDGWDYRRVRSPRHRAGVTPWVESVVSWLGLFGYLGGGVLGTVLSICEAELADNADFALGSRRGGRAFPYRRQLLDNRPRVAGPIQDRAASGRRSIA